MLHSSRWRQCIGSGQSDIDPEDTKLPRSVDVRRRLANQRGGPGAAFNAPAHTPSSPPPSTSWFDVGRGSDFCLLYRYAFDIGTERSDDSVTVVVQTISFINLISQSMFATVLDAPHHPTRGPILSCAPLLPSATRAHSLDCTRHGDLLAEMRPARRARLPPLWPHAPSILWPIPATLPAAVPIAIPGAGQAVRGRAGDRKCAAADLGGDVGAADGQGAEVAVA